jgi:hypothetical protein
MSDPEDANSYENLAFSRDDDGVLVLRFHTNGGPVVFTAQTHEDLPAALEQISLDRENKALVITGSGDVFMNEIDGPSLGEIFKPAVLELQAEERSGREFVPVSRIDGDEVPLRRVLLASPGSQVAFPAASKTPTMWSTGSRLASRTIV